MNTSTKQTENLAKCSDKSKPLLVAVTCQLTERFFQLKTDKVNDDRLGIKLSLQMKLVNMLKFTMKILICIFCIMDLMANILPIGFDVLFIKKIWRVLDGILANCL
jgi:hypothetical protein